LWRLQWVTVVRYTMLTSVELDSAPRQRSVAARLTHLLSHVTRISYRRIVHKNKAKKAPVRFSSHD
jgi:hypothetical protein